jgi:hypothetical protein
VGVPLAAPSPGPHLTAPRPRRCRIDSAWGCEPEGPAATILVSSPGASCWQMAPRQMEPQCESGLLDGGATIRVTAPRLRLGPGVKLDAATAAAVLRVAGFPCAYRGGKREGATGNVGAVVHTEEARAR